MPTPDHPHTPDASSNPLAEQIASFYAWLSLMSSTGWENWLSWSLDDRFYQPIHYSALAVDLDGDGVELVVHSALSTSPNSISEWFPAITVWVAPDDGVLAIDIDEDGSIDPELELIGSRDAAGNGFLALAVFDQNGDGVINADDEGYSDLVVWRDLDGDGLSSDGELLTLPEAEIVEISLDATGPSEERPGNTIHGSAAVEFVDGPPHEIEDLSVLVGWETQSIEEPVLPDLHPGFAVLASFFGVLGGSNASELFGLDGATLQSLTDLFATLASGDVAAFLEDLSELSASWSEWGDDSPPSDYGPAGAGQVSTGSFELGTDLFDLSGIGLEEARPTVDGSFDLDAPLDDFEMPLFDTGTNGPPVQTYGVLESGTDEQNPEDTEFVHIVDLSEFAFA